MSPHLLSKSLALSHRFIKCNIKCINYEKPTQCHADQYDTDDFANFFADRVDSVRSSTASTPLQQISATASHSLHDWTPVMPSDVVKLIGAAANKTCQLDPVPTCWLKGSAACWRHL